MGTFSIWHWIIVIIFIIFFYKFFKRKNNSVNKIMVTTYENREENKLDKKFIKQLEKYMKTIFAILSLYVFAVYFVKPLLISYEGEIIPIIILYFRIWIFFIMSGINLDIFEQFLILPFFLIWLFIHWWIKWSLKSAGIT